MENKKTLYDHIKAFQEGEDVLHELVRHVKIKEYNENNKAFDVIRLRFNDKKLNYFLKTAKNEFHWVDPLDIESWFMSGLFGDKGNKGILQRANLDYSPQQLIAWVSKRINGHISNMIGKENKDDKWTIRESISSEDEEDSDPEDRLTHYDTVQYNQWNDDEYYKYSTTYASFLNHIGGIKGILSEQQYKIYLMLQEQNATQESVADDLNISQQSVSKTKITAEKRIKQAYLQHRTYETLTKDKRNTYHKIVTFQKDYENIIKFDLTDQFDYFGFVANWLKENKTDKDDQIDYFTYHKNNIDYSRSVIDILIDNLKPNEHELFTKILQAYVYSDREIKLFKREKDKFVMATLRSFNTYKKMVEESVDSMSEIFIDKVKENDYEAVGKLFVS